MSNHSFYVGANIATNTNTWRDWLDKTNRIIYDLSTGVVMLAANSTGETTSGNGFVSGNFGANVLIASTALRGGTVSTPNTLNISSAVNIANTLSVANGITGDLVGTANNANNLGGQPASYYSNATNLASGTVPNARLPVSNTSQSGIVQLVDSVANTSTSHAATANAVKTAYDAITSSAATAYSNAVAVAANADNLTSGTVPAARLRAANTTQSGIVQLVDSVANTSVVLAPTANAVKTAYDAATAAYTNAVAIATNASSLASGTVPSARLPSSNTTQSGIVQLVDSYSNTSTTHAPTAKALNDFFNLYSNTAIPPSNLPAANTTQAGIVQLTTDTNSTSQVLSPTASALKVAYDAAIAANTLAANAHTAAANASYLTNGTVAAARLPAANTTQAGIVQLVDSVANTSTTIAATANAVKTANDNAANASFLSSGTVPTARLPASNTTQSGVVQLSDSVTSTAITLAATANAAKTAYDTAISANTLAANAHTAAANATYLTNGTVAAARLPSANTTQAGIVQLVDSVANTSAVIAPTANAVKLAYDAAINANTNAANATFLTNGTVAAARLPASNTTQSGIVQLVDSVVNTSIVIAATANAVKLAYDAAINANTNAANATFLTNGTVAVARLPSSNTTASGIVQLSDSISNTSITLAATANAVRTAYNVAVTANTNASNASFLTSGTVATARLPAANTTASGIVQLVDSVVNTSITIAPTANAVKLAYDAAINANTNAANATFLTNGTVPTARLATTLQNLINSTGISGVVTVSTSAPSGGANNDIWLERAV